jgi:hypothetical protein
MDPWLTALLLKFPLGVLMFVLLFGGARILALVVYWLLPRGRLKTWLFRVDDSGRDPPPPKLIPRRKADL